MSNYQKIEKDALQIRINILKMLLKLGYGHVGGSLSIVEILSVLYNNHINYDINNPLCENRDMLVLSKGHAGPGLYSCLSHVGFFDEEELYTLNAGGTKLPSHPDRLKTKGVDMTTGSLGQGLSCAAGIAMGNKLLKNKKYVYTIVGDGELNEGQCWESFLFINNYKLDNLIVIIDNNKKQLDGTIEETMELGDLKLKMESFGFHTKVVKGNDIIGIDKSINDLKNIKGSALCLILDSIKGQGVKFFEELEANHSVKFDNEEIINKTKEIIIDLENNL